MRGGLISLLYDKTLELDMEKLTDSAAMSLMTTDIDSIATNWINTHEIWASPIDVGIGVYLLQQKLGIAYIARVALALLSQWEDLSLRENTLGGLPFEERLYKDVLFVTYLGSEISKFPQEDQTKLGSKAVNLSGSQSQRVAVALAIYARKPLLLLDDSFSGSDTTSQSLIHSRLFGPPGFLGKVGCTVVLATHSTRYLNNVDSVLILGNDEVIHRQGPTEQLGLTKDMSNKDSQGPDNSEEPCSSASQDQSDNTTRPLASANQFLSDDLARQKGGLSIYKYYLKSGGTFNLLIYVLLNSLYVF
ncbi:hypothetical protein BBP40_002695 [Aspergillus hancockii]|nr:hypothetical protein BBP40_002695 [Aspergillus hancockii]